MSERRLRNTAAVITLPLIDYNTGEYYSGTWEALTNAAVTVYHWSDNTAAAELTIAGVPTQIGSTGLWQISFTANELNISSQYVVIKIDADELAAQGALIELVDSFIETTADQIKSKTDLIPAIKAKTDLIPTSPATSTEVAACLQASGYTAPDNASITAIKAKTDNLPTDPASETSVALCLQSTDYVAYDDTTVISAIDSVLNAVQGLNDISVADITSSTTLKIIRAAVAGKFTVSNGAYTFFDTDGITELFTATIAASSRTIS